MGRQVSQLRQHPQLKECEAAQPKPLAATSAREGATEESGGGGVKRQRDESPVPPLPMNPAAAAPAVPATGDSDLEKAASVWSGLSVWGCRR